MYYKYFFQALLSILIVSFANGSERVIKCMVYNNFENLDYNYSMNLVHVTATSDVDVIHYFWSSYRLPSVIIATTTKDTNITIDQEKLLLFQKDAIKFSEKPLASTGFTITELWENSYKKDFSEVNEVESVTALNLNTFQWHHLLNSSINCSEQFALTNLISSAAEDQIFSKGGSMQIELSVASSQKSSSDYPHLIYTGNSTQMKVVFNNFYSNFSRARYALEIKLFAPLLNDCSHSNKECKPVVTESISDEYSPGIFTDIELLPPCSHNSFLSWRPVAYLNEKPTVANSTDAKITSDCAKSTIIRPQSIAELYFSDQNKYSVSAFNVTFGAVGDGFYNKNKYSMWSLMIGVGHSIGAHVSPLAVAFASIGLGSILLFIVGGLIYIGIQKWRTKSDDEKDLLTENPEN